MPSVSVVICSRDRSAQLEECLRALNVLCYPNLEIVVVDNGTRPEETESLADRYGARYAREPIAGVSRARNRGARFVQSEIVAFFDDDAVPSKDWLCRLVEEFSDPSVMIVTGAIRPTSEPYGSLDLHFAQRGQRRVFDSRTTGWFAGVNFGAAGDGANMAFRRRVFEEWPGFNERLGLGTTIRGSAEHNAFFEVVKRGHRLVFTPDAVVYHPFPETLAEAQNRYRRTTEATFAYMAFLFFSEPKHRWEILSFLAKGVARRLTFQRKNSFVSRWKEFRSLVGGLAPGLRKNLRGKNS